MKHVVSTAPSIETDASLEPDSLAFNLKRILDVTIVLTTTPLWVPIFLILFALIWLEDYHNPLFLQQRIGRNGKPFNTIKFRTMVPDAEAVLQRKLREDAGLRKEWETFFKLRNDPRVTIIGRFLRRTSLDEIPQLLNVLRGDMALVGPRPLPSYHLSELPSHVRTMRQQVSPGITGLWQVSGRSDAGNEGMIEWDPYYVENWSLRLDSHILLRTVRVVLKGSGAY